MLFQITLVIIYYAAIANSYTISVLSGKWPCLSGPQFLKLHNCEDANEVGYVTPFPSNWGAVYSAPFHTQGGISQCRNGRSFDVFLRNWPFASIFGEVLWGKGWTSSSDSKLHSSHRCYCSQLHSEFRDQESRARSHLVKTNSVAYFKPQKGSEVVCSGWHPVIVLRQKVGKY